MTSAEEALRRTGFSVAYRMLGSVADAEDIVQEALLRLHQAEAKEEIASPVAFLTTVVTRLSIDHLRSARVRRAQYFGPWLPEPLLPEAAADAATHAEMADSLSLAFLVVLETLAPVERAVFLLRDVFDLGYDEIAAIVGKSEANCRQLATRARKHVDERRPRFETSRDQREELARRFFDACERGDMDGLISLLSEDVVLYGDGGGNAPAAAQPVFGQTKVSKLLLGIADQARRARIRGRLTEVNRQPGAVFSDERGRLVFVMSLDIVDGVVQTVRSLVNPEKLAHLGPLADYDELAARLRGSRGTD
jgi:RNA polymerase sigma-70 factor (ECF subfamily)